MNLYGIALSTALLLIPPMAHAASTVELTVKGHITPLACTPTLSGGGVVDLEKISHQDLNIETGTRLPLRQLSLGISCNGPTRFALLMTDNRDGSANVNSEIFYGLGLDNSGNKVGLFSVSFDPTLTVVDSVAQIYGTESTTGGVAWRPANLRPIDIGSQSYLAFTDTEGSTAGPSAIQNLNTLLKVEVVLAALKNLDLSTDVRIDGSGSLQIVYL
jgi:hypothetical protein